MPVAHRKRSVARPRAAGCQGGPTLGIHNKSGRPQLASRLRNIAAESVPVNLKTHGRALAVHEARRAEPRAWARIRGRSGLTLPPPTTRQGPHCKHRGRREPGAIDDNDVDVRVEAQP